MVDEIHAILALGGEGTFTHQAAYRFAELYNTNPKNIALKKSNEEVILQTIKDYKSFGVVPFETTGSGLVPEVIDTLIKNLDRNPKICGSHIMPIEQCFAYKGELSKIKTVLSKPEAIKQCQTYLDQLSVSNPGIKKEYADSTSQAAAKASEDETVAAICSKLAAELNGLHCVSGIQDSKNNETRFIMISDNDCVTPTGIDDRTLLFYEVENKPAALDNAISAFGRRSLNKTIQTSIATRISLGRYAMLTEVQAHRSDTRMQRALREVEEEWAIPGSLYVFGSYPVYGSGK